MKNSALALSLLSLSCLSLFFGCGIAEKNALAEESCAEGPVEIVVKDFFDREVPITVEHRNGNYYLADYERNIFVYDGTTATQEDEIFTESSRFPIVCSESADFEDKMAVSVYSNAVKAYDFYCRENIGFDWKGVNGQQDAKDNSAFPLFLYVHTDFNSAVRDQVTARRFDQLGWKPSWILVGDGSNSNPMQNRGAALDLIAHEYQHLITQFLAPDGLLAQGESGAIDEAISDLFGILVEAKTKRLFPDQAEFWQFGEDATVTHEAIRDLKNPETDSFYLTNYKDRVVCSHELHDENCDFGGVHRNSTILTHTQFLACQYTDEFTAEKIGTLWAETLKRLERTSDLMDFERVFRETAFELGYSQEIQNAIATAFERSGFDPIYRVDFLDRNGEIISSSFLREDESATAPEIAGSVKQDGYRFEFEQWDKDFTSVTENLTVKPVYRKIKYFTVKFVDDAGNEIASYEVDEGEAAFGPAAPEKPNTAQYEYSFVGWSEPLAKIQSDLVVHPIYDKAIRSYEVILFIDGESSIYELEYGDSLELFLPKGATQWYTDSDCLNPYPGTVSEKIILYTRRPKNRKAGLIAGITVGVSVLVVTGAVLALVLIRKRNRSD